MFVRGFMLVKNCVCSLIVSLIVIYVDKVIVFLCCDVTGNEKNTGYMAVGSPIPGEIIYRSSLNSQGVPSSPLIDISDRLVVDAIRRASLTNRPSTVKYPPDYFNGPEEQSSSSSDEEPEKKNNNKKIVDKIV